MDTTKVSLNELQIQILQWSHKTFGKFRNSLPDMQGAYLAVDKLIELKFKDCDNDLTNTPIKDELCQQYADVMIFLIDAMAKDNISIDELIVAIDKRHGENVKSQWTPINSDGMSTRIKPTAAIFTNTDIHTGTANLPPKKTEKSR